jgi:hypothetical protein
MSGTNHSNNSIINNGSNIKFMATGIDTLAGSNSGYVSTYTGINTYT